jgi:anti-sigma factor RsiW
LQNEHGAITIAFEWGWRGSHRLEECPVTCREFTDFIMDYHSSELSSELRARFDQHLDLCANCRNYLTSYEETVKLGKKAFDDENAELPADVPDELVRAILAARGSA